MIEDSAEKKKLPFFGRKRRKIIEQEITIAILNEKLDHVEENLHREIRQLENAIADDNYLVLDSVKVRVKLKRDMDKYMWMGERPKNPPFGDGEAAENMLVGVSAQMRKAALTGIDTEINSAENLKGMNPVQ